MLRMAKHVFIFVFMEKKTINFYRFVVENFSLKVFSKRQIFKCTFFIISYCKIGY